MTECNQPIDVERPTLAVGPIRDFMLTARRIFDQAAAASKKAVLFELLVTRSDETTDDTLRLYINSNVLKDRTALGVIAHAVSGPEYQLPDTPMIVEMSPSYTVQGKGKRRVSVTGITELPIGKHWLAARELSAVYALMDKAHSALGLLFESKNMFLTVRGLAPGYSLATHEPKDGHPADEVRGEYGAMLCFAAMQEPQVHTAMPDRKPVPLYHSPQIVLSMS